MCKPTKEHEDRSMSKNVARICDTIEEMWVRVHDEPCTVRIDRTDMYWTAYLVHSTSGGVIASGPTEPWQADAVGMLFKRVVEVLNSRAKRADEEADRLRASVSYFSGVMREIY